MFQTIPFILCHMLTYILHTNYDTQSSYKTVELLCTKDIEEYTQLCSKFRLYSLFSPSLASYIVVYRPERLEASAVAYVLSSPRFPIG